MLFGEGPGRYLVEVTSANAAAFAEMAPSARRIGSVTDTNTVRLAGHELTLEAIERAWKQAP